MNKLEYQILRKNIPSVEIVSGNTQSWYDYNGNLVEWSGSVYIGPNQNDVYYNYTGSLPIGYYKWTGTTWNSISNSEAFDDYNLPIYLDSSVDELGGLVSFDGEIQQVEQIINFTYTQTGSTIEVYSSTNPDILKVIVEQNFTINWGDGFTSGLTVNNGVVGDSLPSISHTYTGTTGYTITISMDSPWTNQKLSKRIYVPKWDLITTNPLGTYTGLTIPSYINLTGQTQNYLNDYDYVSGNTGYTTFTYMSLGKSRISEKKLYGSNQYLGVTTGVTDGFIYSAYTIENLYYQDFSDGYTSITGTTTGYTKEEVFNTLITRNEHFLGFIEDPIIYSDIFIERGKQNVSEKNLRLGEIDNTGELDIYGNGYFFIRKQ
jgi:hypothetical protein